MALSTVFGRGRGGFWDIPDPMDMMVTMFDNAPAHSLARDVHAIASTNVDWKETPTEHIFKAELPGLRRDEIKVEIEDGRTLSISGKRQKEEVHNTDTVVVPKVEKEQHKTRSIEIGGHSNEPQQAEVHHDGGSAAQ